MVIGGNVRSDDGETSIAAHKEDNGLLQLRVFRLGIFRMRYVGVGVFPQREEILIGRLGSRHVALQDIGVSETEMRECSDGFVYAKPRWSRIFWNSAAASLP